MFDWETDHIVADICAQLREIDEFKGVIECLKHDDDDIRQRASGCLWYEKYCKND